MDRLKVVRGNVVPRDVANLVDDIAACFLKEPDLFIVKSDQDLRECWPEPIQPHWGPFLKNQPALREQFASKLAFVNLITGVDELDVKWEYMFCWQARWQPTGDSRWPTSESVASPTAAQRACHGRQIWKYASL